MRQLVKTSLWILAALLLITAISFLLLDFDWLNSLDPSSSSLSKIEFAAIAGGLLVADILLPVPSSAVVTLAGNWLGIPASVVLCSLALTLASLAGYAMGYGSRSVSRRRDAAIDPGGQAGKTDNGTWPASDLPESDMQESDDRSGLANTSADHQIADAFVQNYGLAAIVLLRPLPILAEASTLLAGYYRLPTLPFIGITFSSNLLLCILYSSLGWLANSSETLLTVALIAALLPMALLLLLKPMLRRWALANAPQEKVTDLTTDVLVIDDQDSMCQMVQELLEMHQLSVSTTTDPNHGLQQALSREFAVVVTDVQMPSRDGLEICRQLAAARPEIPVIIMTAFGNLETAVQAIRDGAFDFVTKPFEVDLLVRAVKRAVEYHRLTDQVRIFREQASRNQFDSLIGDSKPMVELFELMQRVARTDSTVLITGESGTGKELVAQSLHQRGRRAAKPFVTVNCAAVPEALLESELFGFEKGAFTGADRNHDGLFRRADGGTLFLDEIGEMPANMQAKLLRVLEESRVLPVGGKSEISVDVRVICATHRELEDEVLQKRFREDLYFRINVIPIPIPPLRQRGLDILALAQSFLKKFAQLNNTSIDGFSAAASEKLLEYHWPGNVRELRNVVERAVTLARFSQIEIDDLPAKIRQFEPRNLSEPSEQLDEILPMAEIEKQYIVKVLKACRGNKSQAAKLLGFDRTTLYRKLEQYEIQLDK